MSAINFASHYKGIKGCQGTVISGLTPTSTYQTQYHAPIKNIYAGIPNGRIVYLTEDGVYDPVCPVNAVGKFAMPLLLNEGGANIATVPITYAANSGTPLSEAPYMSAIPQPAPNLMAIPMCTGYEFMSTECDPEEEYPYNTALTSKATAAFAASDEVGMIVPLTEDTEMCIGFVSRPWGRGRQWGYNQFADTNYPTTMQKPTPNPMVSVTGKNQPAVSFWGCPLPCGAVSN